jgi:hypothetical protein
MNMCREDDGQGGGGRDALPVAEPCLQRRVPQQHQLRQRMQDGEVHRRRVQDGRRHAQVLLQEGLLGRQQAPAVRLWLIRLHTAQLVWARGHVPASRLYLFLLCYNK